MESYKVLIAVGDAAARGQVREALERASLTTAGEAQTREEVAARLTEARPDVLLIDVALLPPDGGDGGADSAAAMTSVEGTGWSGPLLVLTGAPGAGDGDSDGRSPLRERIARSGAFATICLPVDGEEAAAAIDLAVRRFRELQGCQESLDKLQNRLADRIVIERAKGLLMQAEGLTEEEAFRRIHFDARKRNRTMRSVAEEVLGQNAGAAEVGPPPSGVGSADPSDPNVDEDVPSSLPPRDTPAPTRLTAGA